MTGSGPGAAPATRTHHRERAATAPGWATRTPGASWGPPSPETDLHRTLRQRGLRLRPTAAAAGTRRRTPASRVTARPAVAAAIRGGRVDGVIFHADRASEYSSKACSNRCERLGAVQCPGRVGAALGNAATGSSHSTIRIEYIHRYRLATRADPDQDRNLDRRLPQHPPGIARRAAWKITGLAPAVVHQQDSLAGPTAVDHSQGARLDWPSRSSLLRCGV